MQPILITILLLLTLVFTFLVKQCEPKNSTRQQGIEIKNDAADTRRQHWKVDLIGELELTQIRNRYSGLIRPRGTTSYKLFGLRTFDLMINPVLKSMKSGFPGAAYSSGLLPTLFWWVRIYGSFCIEDEWGTPKQKDSCKVYREATNCNQLFQIHTFNTMLHQMDWENLMRSCNEISSPRCSWHKFLGLLDPYAIDYYSQIDLRIVYRFVGFTSTPTNQFTHGPIFFLPYKENSCYPIRDIDTLSALYIYTFCHRYKRELLNASNPASRQRWLCPNPCLGNPCAVKNFATGSCVVLGFLNTDYECKCRHNFRFERTIGECKPMDLCSNNKFCQKLGTAACQFNVTSGQATCVCHNGFMGRRCELKNDPCVNRWHHPALITGNEACRVTGFTGNKCIPVLGSNLYTCNCSSGYLPSSDHPYSNCYKIASPCTKRICLYGSCIESDDTSTTSCQCEHGFHGENCEHLKGLWSQWAPWTECSPHCSHRLGDVTRKRRRVCLGPSVDCFGPEAEFEVCLGAVKCLEPLPPEADALRHMRDWCNTVFLPTVGVVTTWVAVGLVVIKLLEISLGRILRVAFERWQMRINPQTTMELPSAEGT